MNYSAEILEYLSSLDTFGSLILAPNAPPVIKTADGLAVALHAVLDASDVLDTLTALIGQTQKTSQTGIPSSGMFSFGVRDMGRIRVRFITQRGSKVVNVTRIPFKIPTLESVCDHQEVLRNLLHFIEGGPNGGVLAVSGPSAFSNAVLVYALLGKVNQTSRRIICILEHTLTFLMAHADSIVIQSELNSDVRDFPEGLQNSSVLGPDILYVGDVRSGDSLPGLTDIVQGRAITILSSVALDGRTLLAKCSQEQEPGHLPSGVPAALLRVLPAAHGKVDLIHEEFLSGPDKES